MGGYALDWMDVFCIFVTWHLRLGMRTWYDISGKALMHIRSFVTYPAAGPTAVFQLTIQHINTFTFRHRPDPFKTYRPHI